MSDTRVDMYVLRITDGGVYRWVELDEVDVFEVLDDGSDSEDLSEAWTLYGAREDEPGRFVGTVREFFDPKLGIAQQEKVV